MACPNFKNGPKNGGVNKKTRLKNIGDYKTTKNKSRVI
jgi:hypothetical protein